MYAYSLAAAFLLAVTASPLPDLSPLGYLLPTSGQPNIAPILFQDFLAQSSTNLDNYNFEQSQILAQSPETDPGNYKFAQPQVLSQIPSTNSDGYNLRQPQILAESYEKGRPETVRGDALEGNEPIPLPITGPTSNYLPSDIKFQQASCSATSSVWLPTSLQWTGFATRHLCRKYVLSKPNLISYPHIHSPICASEISIEFAGLDQSSIKDFRNAKFGRYCFAPKYFGDCNQMWSWVLVSQL